MILRRSTSIARVFLFGLPFTYIIGCGTGTPPAVPSAQPSAVNDGPKLGYFWSATERSLRPILGVPGSSQVGQSIVPAGVYVSGTAAADTGLLLTTEGNLFALHSARRNHHPGHNRARSQCNSLPLSLRHGSHRLRNKQPQHSPHHRPA